MTSTSYIWQYAVLLAPPHMNFAMRLSFFLWCRCSLGGGHLYNWLMPRCILKSKKFVYPSKCNYYYMHYWIRRNLVFLYRQHSFLWYPFKEKLKNLWLVRWRLQNFFLYSKDELFQLMVYSCVPDKLTYLTSSHVCMGEEVILLYLNFFAHGNFHRIMPEAFCNDGLG